MDRVDEIKERVSKATEGPWCWFGNTDVHSMYLATVHSGRKFVMRFSRWGMQSGQPMFQVKTESGGIMTPASELVRYEVAPEVIGVQNRKSPTVYRGDFHDIAHPDADFIAHAREDVPYLLDELEKKDAEIVRLKGTPCYEILAYKHVEVCNELASSHERCKGLEEVVKAVQKRRRFENSKNFRTDGLHTYVMAEDKALTALAGKGRG